MTSRDREDDAASAEPPASPVELRRAPRWVWLLPIVALAIVGWLGARALVAGDRDIVVRFTDAHGVRPESAVRWKGVPVGRVREVRVAKDHRGVEMRITMDGAFRDLLRKDAQFWVVEPNLSGGQLPSVIAGAYMAFEPGKGEPATEFDGLSRPPVVQASEPGRSLILESRDASSISAGTALRYRGVAVGRVQGLRLEEGDVRVHIFVPEPHARLVREGTRFWTAGSVSLETEGGLGLRVPSLGALVGGGICFDAPAAMAGPEAPTGTVFALFDSREAAEADMPAASARYVVRLPGDIDGLAPGAAVMLRGMRVGRVRTVRLECDEARAAICAPIVIDIDATRMGLEVPTSTSRADLRRRLDATLARLVERGLRARVKGSLLPASASIVLEVVPDAAPARLDLSRDPPELPGAMPGGLGAALASVGEAAGPVMASVRRITTRLEEIVGGEEVRRSLAHVERSLAGLETVATSAASSAGPVLKDLEAAVRSVEATSRKLDRLLGGPATQGEGISDLVKELVRTSQAVRELSAYISRHPEAFVTGRKGQ